MTTAELALTKAIESLDASPLMDGTAEMEWDDLESILLMGRTSNRDCGCMHTNGCGDR
jgi:hypothetical protein